MRPWNEGPVKLNCNAPLAIMSLLESHAIRRSARSVWLLSSHCHNSAQITAHRVAIVLRAYRQTSADSPTLVQFTEFLTGIISN